MMKIGILEERIIDWYDGPVRSVLRTDEMGGWLYCSLLSWNMAEDCKIFVALELSAEWPEELFLWANEGQSNGPGTNWDDFIRMESRLIDAYCGQVCLLVSRGSGGKMVSIGDGFPFDLVRSDLGCGVEGAVAPERVHKWSRFLDSVIE